MAHIHIHMHIHLHIHTHIHTHIHIHVCYTHIGRRAPGKHGGRVSDDSRVRQERGGAEAAQKPPMALQRQCGRQRVRGEYG